MKTFILYWDGGSCETLVGRNIADACNRAGIGAGAIVGVDFYEESETPTYVWDKNETRWIKR